MPIVDIRKDTQALTMTVVAQFAAPVARENITPHHGDGDAASQNRRQVIRRSKRADGAQLEVEDESDEERERELQGHGQEDVDQRHDE